MTSNSGISFVGIQHNIYSSSELGRWIQESISLIPYDGTLKLSTINGIYVQVRQADLFNPLRDFDLAQEFSAWEAASDEALRNFEQELK